MKEPIRILSDLHLGHKVSRIDRVSALRPLLEGAGTVIFNGDTWQEMPSPFRARSESMLAELKALGSEVGVETIYLPGNHDPGWDGCGWVELAEGRIIVTHGDALFYDGSPWKREILQGNREVQALWQQHPKAEDDVNERLQVARRIALELFSEDYPEGRHFIQRVWDALMPPKRALRMIQGWWGRAAAANRFCDLYFPKAEVIIFGHFHRHGCWNQRGRLLIDSGSFMNPGRAHWVEWRDRMLVRGEIDEGREAFTLGRRLGVWRF